MIAWIRGEEFASFARWLAKQLDTPAFDRGNPLPVDAAKRIVEYLEPAIAKKVFQEAANIAATQTEDTKAAAVAAIQKRCEAL
jgi:hypothetical protein